MYFPISKSFSNAFQIALTSVTHSRCPCPQRQHCSNRWRHARRHARRGNSRWWHIALARNSAVFKAVTVGAGGSAELATAGSGSTLSRLFATSGQYVAGGTANKGGFSFQSRWNPFKPTAQKEQTPSIRSRHSLMTGRLQNVRLRTPSIRNRLSPTQLVYPLN
jgi:hypothetical protein